MGAAVQRATETEGGGGLSGALHVAFVSAAAAQLLAGVTQVFREQAPDCQVRIQEVQVDQMLRRIRSGEVDLGLTTLPIDDPDLTHGSVLAREAQVLAVPVSHAFARRASVLAADVTHVPQIRPPGHTATPSCQADTPPATADPTAVTFQEALTSSAPAKALSPPAPTPAATTRAPTSPTSPSATPLPWNGSWSGRLTVTPRASEPSRRQLTV
ncbi:LysR family transcriptional regulator substrate-binding protein [Streptomyces sp. NPDC049627]|uniref:LysR family transcriptional regulator substrate-binding protein n=1 Tax=Streptomyces sp. NPDC049627 TaxID=3365595 RepID=UPI00379FFF49